MPGLKGDELLEYIHDRSPQTLNIMISGQADLEAVSHALRSARLYRYISKPWTSEDIKLTIVEAVQRYLQDRKLETQSEQLSCLNQSLEEQIQVRTQELEQKMRELEQLSRLKDEFLHAVTHDLRTPVMGSLLLFRRFQNQNDPIELSRTIVDRIIKSNQRQLKLLDSLLAVQLSDHGFTLSREPIDLARFVNEIQLDLEPILSENQITIRHAIPSNLPLITVDTFQLRRVFENLITNAIKHNPPGIALNISATVENQLLICRVEDNGIGIPEEDCERMFERYQQGSRARRSLGVGLGLYLCRQIIQAHGGQIGVVSAINQGAKFWFTLPIQ